MISSAHHTLLIEAEEMNDDAIEQALVNAAQHGVRIEVILPAPHGSQSDSNSQGIDTIKQGGVQVKEDSKLYMHAKIIVMYPCMQMRGLVEGVRAVRKPET